jgi:hypothetical protein
MKDFFISYTSADRPWAEWIAWQLEAVGYTTVLQAWDFRPGSNFIMAMQQAAMEAERTIAVLSPQYLTSRFTQPEWTAAFAQDPRGDKGLLVPVRIQACDPRGLLPQIVYIDLVGLDETAARAALLAGIQQGRAKPTTAPGFPGAQEPAESPGIAPPHFPGATAGAEQETSGALFDQRGQYVIYQQNIAGHMTEPAQQQVDRDIRGTPLQNLVMSHLSHGGGTLSLHELCEKLALLGFARQAVAEEMWNLREKRWIRFQDPLHDASLITTRIIDLGAP